MQRWQSVLMGCAVFWAMAGCAGVRQCVVTAPPAPRRNPAAAKQTHPTRTRTLLNATNSQSREASDPSGVASLPNVPGPPTEILDPWWLRDDADSMRFLPQRVADDHRNFYSPRSLTQLGIGLGIGAILANTSIDEGLQQRIPSFAALHQLKPLGDGRYTLPVFAAALVVGQLFEDIEPLNTTGEWGERSLRAFVVGAPPLIVGQMLTGGSRPSELGGSAWHPFQDNNGVSGHSFMGAIPFLTAAKMTDNVPLKAGLTVASTLVGLSRVTDDAHFFSQAMLGWWLAYLATDAVTQTQDHLSGWQIVPLPPSHGTGMGLEYRW